MAKAGQLNLSFMKGVSVATFLKKGQNRNEGLVNVVTQRKGCPKIIVSQG
jgi:hypothetical protein